jgi:hypothetical protein
LITPPAHAPCREKIFLVSKLVIAASLITIAPAVAATVFAEKFDNQRTSGA